MNGRDREVDSGWWIVEMRKIKEVDSGWWIVDREDEEDKRDGEGEEEKEYK
jgi:hypothetical protein